MMKFVLGFLCSMFSQFTFGQQNMVVNFDFDHFDLTSQAQHVLDSFTSTGIENIRKISLYGHCDSVGSNIYNDKLSRNRVKTVEQYLLGKGIDRGIFEEEKGFGKRKPAAVNSTEYGRFQNRRVEIAIIRKNSVITQPETLTQKITDSSTKIGTTIILKNLNFIGGRHVLLPQSIPVLTELLEVLKNNPTLEIEIQGHICCSPGAEDGLDFDTQTEDLSVNRAKAIYLYLQGHGISKERLSYKGFAHKHPLIYPEDTEEKRTTNRRVEIKIIHK